MTAPRYSEIRLLTTAAKIAAIFVAIVSVFFLAMDRPAGEGPILATGEERVIEAPDKPKRALTALAAPAGMGAAGILRR